MSRNTRLLVAAIALHFPIDGAITLAHRHLESNPVVLALGFDTWVLVKVALLVGVIVAYAVGRNDPRMQYPLAAQVALGLVFILPNLLIVAI